MGNNWTNEQRQVVGHSEGNLLVAAAAGSGKTAVLVERIVTMLQDREHPVDIDRMLIVTFTRAAAAEMRERIGNRIAILMEEQPDNEHLHRQQMLLHHAQITTIDSFCMQVVREFFSTIPIDPGFRIGDEAEMKLLQSDVLKALLEENYAEAKEAFLHLVESYAPGKTDAALEEYIMKLYLFSESYEWPEQWLWEQAENFVYESEEAFESSSLINAVMQEVGKRTILALEDIREALELVNDAGLEGYRATVQLDLRFVEQLAGQNTYASYSEMVRAYKFAPIGRCAKDVDAEARERAKALRDRCKDTISELVKLYFFQSFHAMYEDMSACAPHMKELVRLTVAFRKKYSETKQDKNLLDFSDLGHYALQILLTEQDGIFVPSEAAGILRSRYDRIMVDEYQDSNQIQETLLWAVSRLHDVNADYPDGRPNIFMVGDVKQSIYRFRQARPELFMKKYDEYGQENSPYQKIVLKQNFRSRPAVLDAVNSVFEWCMQREFGGIEYDADAALHAGLPYEKCDETENPYDPELLLVYHTDENEEESVEKVVAEAEICAERIRSLTGENGLLITENGQMRRVKPGDVAILLRSAKGWAETFVAVLKDMGIAARATVSTGFFEAGEVATVLNYLRILDNPKQDIPFVQILLSPVGGFTNNELAAIKNDSQSLYDMMNGYAENVTSQEGEANITLKKVRNFLEQYRYFRKRMKYLSVSELIQEIYQKTELYAIMAALPAGKQRIANLEYLLCQAKSFEATSYHGLFQFVRYVEKLKDNEVDFGEASTVDTEDAVRIMTIHKSKGLEFPIVLVPGCGKKFNQMDANTRIVLHADHGMGPECIDSTTRTKITTLKKQYIRQALKEETIAEELRMLYVAMTRAREKLILVGSTGNAESFLESCAAGTERMDYRKLSSANSYLDFMKGRILSSLAEREFASLSADNPICLKVKTTGNPVVWHFAPVKAGSVSVEEAIDRLEEKQRREELLAFIGGLGMQEQTEWYQKLKECAWYRYPFEKATQSPLKTSVSELKRRKMLEDGAEAQEAAIPAWVKQEKKETPQGIGAAERGTLYHKALELLPFAEIKAPEGILQYMERLVSEGKLTQEEADCIEQEKIWRFLESDLGRRIRKADAEGKLKKEQPFVLGMETADGSGDCELVQGIIDLYFEEEDGVVLVDYKTDHVESSDELAERYRIQLQYYASAIRQITGKAVKEILIYSLHLSEQIWME